MIECHLLKYLGEQVNSDSPLVFASLSIVSNFVQNVQQVLLNSEMKHVGGPLNNYIYLLFQFHGRVQRKFANFLTCFLISHIVVSAFCSTYLELYTFCIGRLLQLRSVFVDFY